MRIVGVTTFGGPERLQLLEAPEPHAGPGEGFWRRNRESHRRELLVDGGVAEQ